MGSMPTLILLSGPSAGLRYELAGETILGRSPKCEIALDDDKVSRRHARIRVVDGQSRIADLGSRNGTRVNGQRISSEVALSAGDRLELGDTTAQFDAAFDALAESDPLDLCTWAVEDLLPAEGAAAGIYAVAASLAGARSTADLLHRALEELVKRIGTSRTAVFWGSAAALTSAAEIGPAPVRPAASLARAALQGQVATAGTAVCAPLGGVSMRPIGILYAERSPSLGPQERAWVAAIGRLAGEWIAAGGAHPTAEPMPLVGGSRAFRRMMERAEQAARSQEHLALIGGPGVGKRSLARHIHTRSRRALGPWIAVSCSDDPSSVERSLFGEPHAKELPAVSALLRAHRGSLLLHRLECLPKAIGQRLADFLSRKVAPLPDGAEQRIDVRIIVTATDPLEVLASKGKVAPELARVPLTRIPLAPLQERSSDVPALFKVFARGAAAHNRQEPPRLSQEARRLLMGYGWPGNIRELRLVAERLALLYPGLEVPVSKLPAEILDAGSAPAGKLEERISRLEREAVLEALRESRGKKLRAAALLGISRPTLDKKIRDFGIIVGKRESV